MVLKGANGTMSTPQEKKRLSLQRDKRRQQKNTQQRASADIQTKTGKYYPDRSPERGTIPKLSPEELLKIALNYEEFSCPGLAPDVTVREGLHNLDDVTAYGVTPELQIELWEKEISRLISVVTEPQCPLSFKGTDELSRDTKDAYEILANLGDQMWNALNIVIHDSEITFSKHCPDMASEQQLKQCRQVLERLTGEDSDDEDEAEGSHKNILAKEASKGTRSDYFQLVDYVTATLARVFCKAAYGKPWHDNVLANLAKLSTKLKVLSAQCEKFAFMSLSMTPEKRPHQAAAPGPTRKPGEAGLNRGGPNDNLQDMLQCLNPSGVTDGPETRRKAVENLYWVHTTKFRFPIHMILQHLLFSLRGQNRLTTTSNTSYELCAMLYDTGFEDFPNLVFQDKNGEYLGSSKPETVNVAHATFEVLDLTMSELEAIKGGRSKSHNIGHGSNAPSRCEPHECTGSGMSASISQDSTTPSATGVRETLPTRDCNEGLTSGESKPQPEQVHEIASVEVLDSVGTRVSWNYTSPPGKYQPRGSVAQTATDTHQSKILYLESMNEVIMVMVPLLLANPKVVDMTTDFIGLCVQTSEYDSPSDTSDNRISLYQETKFKASFCLTTREYCEFWTSRRHWPVSQLSKALMARDKLLSWKSGEGIPQVARTWELPLTEGVQEEERKRNEEEKKECIRKGEQELENAKRKMSEWIFEEDGVRVRCGRYVWAVASGAVVLVLGGIVIGVTLQDRLENVDPFNITTFCWILAVFLVLMAKSSRVENWPWRDFLRRQVLCRSISELHSVTGIDDQLILAKLLHEEPTVILKTRGPYNCVFNRKVDNGSGFSIDVPLSMRTMLLSGLIMIQVQAAYHGEYLVCLDVRRGTDYNVVLQSHHHQTDKREYIVSDKFSIQEHNSPIHRRLPLTKKNITWSRVVGVYGNEDILFI